MIFKRGLGVARVEKKKKIAILQNKAKSVS